jgi:hypothetical protein
MGDDNYDWLVSQPSFWQSAFDLISSNQLCDLCVGSGVNLQGQGVTVAPQLPSPLLYSQDYYFNRIQVVLHPTQPSYHNALIYKHDHILVRETAQSKCDGHRLCACGRQYVSELL